MEHSEASKHLKKLRSNTLHTLTGKKKDWVHVHSTLRSACVITLRAPGTVRVGLFSTPFSNMKSSLFPLSLSPSSSATHAQCTAPARVAQMTALGCVSLIKSCCSSACAFQFPLPRSAFRFRYDAGQVDARTFVFSVQPFLLFVFGKLIWFQLLKDFNCTVTSTWTNNEESHEFHTRWAWGSRGRKKRLDVFMSPKDLHCTNWYLNQARIRTWDHFPVIIKVEGREIRTKRRVKGWAGRAPVSDAEKALCAPAVTTAMTFRVRLKM